MRKMLSLFCSSFTTPIAVALALFLGATVGRADVVLPTTRPFPLINTAAVPKGPFVLHLPGIGGYLHVDQRFIAGLKQGGVAGQIYAYNWTEHDPGLHALHAYARNQTESGRIADMILARRKADPNNRLSITGHSGGCAMAIWALEKLPADCFVDDVVLMAPALSPTYDLTAALKHIRGHLYSFTSTSDVLILSTGTRLFGTMDGVECDAAGFGGFQMPKTADPEQYKKLVSEPYEAVWVRYDNSGNHIGPLSRRFSAAVIAPLLQPELAAATTQPAQ
jgi:hypothetical protein